MEGVHRSSVLLRGLALARKIGTPDCQLIKARDMARGAFNSPTPFAFPSWPLRNRTSPRLFAPPHHALKNYFHADTISPRIVSCFHNHTGLPAACLHDWRLWGAAASEKHQSETPVHISFPHLKHGNARCTWVGRILYARSVSHLWKVGLEIGEEL
jgi:hypothetical protein